MPTMKKKPTRSRTSTRSHASHHEEELDSNQGVQQIRQADERPTGFTRVGTVNFWNDGSWPIGREPR